MNFSTTLRDRRHFFGPTHYSIANYCTETKNEMKTTFGDEYFLNNLHELIPEQLKKNLAETMIAEEKMPPKNEFNKFDVKSNENNHNRTDNSPLAGITNFLSGVLNVISSAMFSKPKQTEFSSETSGEMALECAWHSAKTDDENKILHDEKCPNGVSNANPVAEMGDCRAAATHCQNKLEQVRLLLSKPVPCPVRVKRRPRKAFVDSSSVEDCFEDAFAPEDFENLSNNSYLEYVSPYCYHEDDLLEISAPKIQTEVGPPLETTENNMPEPVKVTETTSASLSSDKKEELVASCEDKLSKLKALLQNRKMRVFEPEPINKVVKEPSKQKPVSKIKDKHYKNPNRCTDKRRKSKMRHSINNDMLFVHEINTEDVSSLENSPTTRTLGDFIPKPSNLEYFDEISGRFHSASVTDSEDSFQIVFNDSPRLRRTSDCESEDSFIIFDDSQDSCYASNNCYTTNDVFRDSSESDSCVDSDSELSDSGCSNLTFRLSHSLSKSVSNLTDDSLYNKASDDEVDCSKVELTVTENEFNSGLLIDSRKREIRRSLPPKKVQFSDQPPRVHVMRVWAFAAKQARIGHWERYALDRERFKRRIADVEVVVSWVLRPQHRSLVMFQRFRPWWNAQKRRELAEKEEQEKVRVQELVEEDMNQLESSSETDELKREQEGINDSESTISSLDNTLQGVSLADSGLVTLPSVSSCLSTEPVCEYPEQVVTPSMGSSKPNELEKVQSESFNNDDNGETDNLNIDLTSKCDEVGEIDSQHLNTRVMESKDLYNSSREGNNVTSNDTLPSIGEVDNLKHDILQESSNSGATELQSGHFDNKLLDNIVQEPTENDSYDVSPKVGAQIEHNNGEFEKQTSHNDGDVIKKSKNEETRLHEIVQHKEILNEETQENNVNFNKNDFDDTKNGSTNTLDQSEHHNTNENLVHKIKNNNSRSENDRVNAQNNQIVPYNDKIFVINNDYIITSLRNA